MPSVTGHNCAPQKPNTASPLLLSLHGNFFFFFNKQCTRNVHDYTINDYCMTFINMKLCKTFIPTKREAHSRLLTHRTNSWYQRRPGCPLTNTPPLAAHKHPDCHATSHYTCHSSCHAPMPTCTARCSEWLGQVRTGIHLEM